MSKVTRAAKTHLAAHVIKTPALEGPKSEVRIFFYTGISGIEIISVKIYPKFSTRQSQLWLFHYLLRPEEFVIKIYDLMKTVNLPFKIVVQKYTEWWERGHYHLYRHLYTEHTSASYELLSESPILSIVPASAPSLSLPPSIPPSTFHIYPFSLSL